MISEPTSGPQSTIGGTLFGSIWSSSSSSNCADVLTMLRSRKSLPSTVSSSSVPARAPTASTADFGSLTPRLLPHFATLTFMTDPLRIYNVYPLAVTVQPLHPLRAAADGRDAGARYLHEPERTHQVDELVDLGGVAGDLEHQALGRG